MSGEKLLRAFLLILVSLSLLAAFFVLDWYPTVKELGRLRRERGDLERNIKDYDATARTFKFSDPEENSLIAQSDAQLLQSLPQVNGDGAWLALAESDLLKRAKSLANRIKVFSDATTFGPKQPGLAGWLKLQAREIGQCLQAADPRRDYPWRKIFLAMPPGGGKLACRPLGVALNVPLANLLDFINHISWGETRLEMVRLHLELGRPISHAWLVCRGSYRVSEPSEWLVLKEKGKGDEDLIIDPDSPLLLQQVAPLMTPQLEKRELPPPGSPW